MSNEFLLRYNTIRDYKYNSFDEYTKNMVSAYSKMDNLINTINTNEKLLYNWKKILTKMDKVIEKRDSIDSWWTNYLENIRRIEQALPDQVVSINKYPSHKYLISHNYTVNSYSNINTTKQSTPASSTSTVKPNASASVVKPNTPASKPAYVNSNASAAAPKPAYVNPNASAAPKPTPTPTPEQKVAAKTAQMKNTSQVADNHNRSFVNPNSSTITIQSTQNTNNTAAPKPTPTPTPEQKVAAKTIQAQTRPNVVIPNTPNTTINSTPTPAPTPAQNVSPVPTPTPAAPKPTPTPTPEQKVAAKTIQAQTRPNVVIPNTSRSTVSSNYSR